MHGRFHTLAVRAASSTLSEMPSTYWRIKKMPKTLAIPGMMTAQ